MQDVCEIRNIPSWLSDRTSERGIRRFEVRFLMGTFPLSNAHDKTKIIISIFLCRDQTYHLFYSINLISDHAFTVLANSTVISTHLVFLMRDQFGTCQSTMFDTLKFIDRRFYQAARGVDYS